VLGLHSMHQRYSMNLEDPNVSFPDTLMTHHHTIDPTSVLSDVLILHGLLVEHLILDFPLVSINTRHCTTSNQVYHMAYL